MPPDRWFRDPKLPERERIVSECRKPARSRRPVIRLGSLPCGSHRAVAEFPRRHAGRGHPGPQSRPCRADGGEDLRPDLDRHDPARRGESGFHGVAVDRLLDRGGDLGEERQQFQPLRYVAVAGPVRPRQSPAVGVISGIDRGEGLDRREPSTATPNPVCRGRRRRGQIREPRGQVCDKRGFRTMRQPQLFRAPQDRFKGHESTDPARPRGFQHRGHQRRHGGRRAVHRVVWPEQQVQFAEDIEHSASDRDQMGQGNRHSRHAVIVPAMRSPDRDRSQ